MTYKKLKDIIKENIKFQEEIYISNCFNRKYEIESHADITIYRNIYWFKKEKDLVLFFWFTYL